MLLKFTKMLLRNASEGEIIEMVLVMVLVETMEMDGGLSLWFS
jgi:hypothetical protein